LANPGFEDLVLNPWYQYQDFSGSSYEDWNITTADSQSGTASATNTGDKGIRQDFSPIATSDINEISFWTRIPTASPTNIPSVVKFFYSDNTTSLSFGFTSTTNWEFLDATSDLISGKQLVGIGFFGHELVGGSPLLDRTFLDNVLIDATVVPLPAAAWLFGSGLLGLVGIGRRKKAA